MHSIPFRTQNFSKCMPKLIQNGSWGPQDGVIGGQNAPDGTKWTHGAPRCAQREVRVRQDGPKRSPKGPLGTPRGPRMTPKGAQGEPKVSPRGSQGAKVDAQEHQNTKKVDCSKSLKNHLFLYQNRASGGHGLPVYATFGIHLVF